MRVGEMNKCNASNKDQHPGVVALTLRFKRIIAKFVTIGLIVHVVFFFKRVSVRVRREDMSVATQSN
jgi:hypothetical protein